MSMRCDDCYCSCPERSSIVNHKMPAWHARVDCEVMVVVGEMIEFQWSFPEIGSTDWAGCTGRLRSGLVLAEGVPRFQTTLVPCVQTLTVIVCDRALVDLNLDSAKSTLGISDSRSGSYLAVS